MPSTIDLALEHFNANIGNIGEIFFKKPIDAGKEKLSPNSSGSSSNQDPEDPDDEEKYKTAKKFKLDPTNGANKKILDNIDKSCQEFISKNRRGKILQEFPGQYLNKSLKDVLQDALEKDRAAITARKLLIDGRFLK